MVSCFYGNCGGENNNMLNSKMRVRRHSAPADLINFNVDNGHLNIKRELQDGSHKSAKSLFQNIIVKSLFPNISRLSKCKTNKCNNIAFSNSGQYKVESVEDVKCSTSLCTTTRVLSYKNEKGTEGTDIKVKIDSLEQKTAERTHQLYLPWKDNFIEVEWDNGGNKREDEIENNQNVKVRQLFVLKPKWLQGRQKVIFRDFHVNLSDFQVEQERVISGKQKTIASSVVIAKSKSLTAVPSNLFSAENGESEDHRLSVFNSINNRDNGNHIVPVAIKKKNNCRRTRHRSLRRKNHHRCELCGKFFSKNSILFQHMICHTGEKPFQCLTCEVRFNKSYSLKRHLRLHTGEKPYKCHTCGKGFARIDHLQNHINTHTRKKVFKCNKCEEKFDQKYLLQIHKGLSHTGESPYQCKFCKKPFSLSLSLSNHIKLGHCKRK